MASVPSMCGKKYLMSDYFVQYLFANINVDGPEMPLFEFDDSLHGVRAFYVW